MAKTSTTHPAITLACTIYDLPGNLTPDQQTFLSEVHEVTVECARAKGEAVQRHGLGSPAYLAEVDRAERKQSDHLAEALDEFERTLEDRDEELEIDLAMAAAE